MPMRKIVLALPLVALAACKSDGSTLMEPGVTVRNVTLPVPGAVYRGGEPHVFMGGEVALFCGVHGSFTSAAMPPAAVGTTVLSEYTARFVGELTLEPPAVTSSETHALDLQARMAESIALRSSSGGVTTYDTELVTFELQGTGMPSGVMVRESTARASTGVTTVTAVSGGESRVETFYDVWLDISLDGGRTWTQADNAVRMTLEAS